MENRMFRLKRILLIVAAFLSMACTPHVSVKYVDLGLPSGLLWATCNIGANRPEDFGDYFAWGETKPKSVYNWRTYRFAKVSNDGKLMGLTKYTVNERYGNVDKKSVLEAADDAATLLLGNGARIPTPNEWSELVAYTTHEWTVQNGVAGYKFIGPNGNTLFLPAAGHRNDAKLSECGKCGFYWSSRVRVGFQDGAYGFQFKSDAHCQPAARRDEGFSLRAVRDKKY